MNENHSQEQAPRRALARRKWSAAGGTSLPGSGDREIHGQGAIRRAGRLLTVILLAGALSSCGTRRPIVHVDGGKGGRQPEHYREVADSPVVASSVPVVFDTGPSIKEEMLALIDSAQDYVLINSFLLSKDEETHEVLEALVRKHRSGVRVHVLTDSSSLYMPGGKEGFRFFEEHGIPIEEYNPMRLYKLVVAPVMLPRDHRKFWVVDGRALFLGGANLYSTSLRSPASDGNRDFMVKVESAGAVSHMIKSFVETWNSESRDKLATSDFPVRARGDGTAELWLTDQNGERGRVENMFQGLFAVAKEEVWLIQPYTFVTPGLLAQFRDLRQRGVTVNVILSGKVQSPRFHYASHYGIKDIQEAGGTVWLYEPENGPLHAKAVVVDGRWVSVGSANLNARSYKLAMEANLVFGDPSSVSRVVEAVDELRAGCRLVDEQEAKRYRGMDYFLSWLVMQVVG